MILRGEMMDNGKVDENAFAGFNRQYEQFVEKHGWSGSTLKLIAVITMLIDHFGAGILETYLVQCPDGGLWGMDYSQIYTLDRWCRGIGRIAFPIFCFLLVEGFCRTRNVWKYIGRMVLFGIISEVPFDLCFFRSPMYKEYQNVYFTLALGLFMLALIELINKLDLAKIKQNLQFGVRVLLKILVVLAISAVATVFMTDYYCLGIITILLLYIGRKSRWRTLLTHAAACTVVLWEMPALAGLAPLALYNGKRGLKLKYFFYLFYPVHLILLWVFSKLLGLA